MKCISNSKGLVTVSRKDNTTKFKLISLCGANNIQACFDDITKLENHNIFGNIFVTALNSNFGCEKCLVFMGDQGTDIPAIIHSAELVYDIKLAQDVFHEPYVHPFGINDVLRVMHIINEIRLNNHIVRCKIDNINIVINLAIGIIDISYSLEDYSIDNEIILLVANFIKTISIMYEKTIFVLTGHPVLIEKVKKSL